jgi:hypothetical protein
MHSLSGLLVVDIASALKTLLVHGVKVADSDPLDGVPIDHVLTRGKHGRDAIG